jgi:hypothetical protein
MAYKTFATSGVVAAASIAVTGNAPTQLITNTRQAVIVAIENKLDAPLEIFFDRPEAPAAGATPDLVLLASTNITLDLQASRRRTSSTIYGRIGAGSGSGSVVVNIVM